MYFYFLLKNMIKLIMYIVGLGLVYWLLSLIPLPQPFLKIILVIMVLFIILMILNVFGIYTGFPHIK